MKLSLGRRYSFSASHRLSRPEWSAEENERVFGKCANPRGHGHNYVLEIAVSGPVDSATGMIANLNDLDRFVRERVLESFEYSNLNEQAPEFANCVPTTENLCRVIYARLAPFPHAHVERVRIEETGKNSFEFAPEHEW